MLRFVKIDSGGARVALVTMESDDRQELSAGEAREIAVQKATMHLGRCGFSAVQDVSYVNPDGVELKTDEELQHKIKPGGRWRQVLRIQGGV